MSMTVAQIAALIDPDRARVAIAEIMVALGSEFDWDSETIEHVASAASAAFPDSLPSVFDQNDAAVEFWAGVR